VGVQKRACDAPGARVFFNCINTTFLPPGRCHGREVLFQRVATSGRCRTRGYEAPVGAHLSERSESVEWGSIILTTPISCLLSKAQKWPGLSEKALKRTKGRTPSKLTTRRERALNRWRGHSADSARLRGFELSITFSRTTRMSAPIDLFMGPGFLFPGSGGAFRRAVTRLCVEHLSNKLPGFSPSFKCGKHALFTFKEWGKRERATEGGSYFLGFCGGRCRD
jgi:hypothetical protein